MKHIKKYPSRQELNYLFEYKNGRLYWKIKPASRVNIGDPAGFKSSAGYMIVKINSSGYLQHRLIYIMHYGVINDLIDHIDGNTLNNDIGNLRECTNAQNVCNGKLRNDNTSGSKGVSWHNRDHVWQAYINIPGRRLYLGSFNDFDVAAQILRIKRIELHGEFANHG